MGLGIIIKDVRLIDSINEIHSMGKVGHKTGTPGQQQGWELLLWLECTTPAGECTVYRQALAAFGRSSTWQLVGRQLGMVQHHQARLERLGSCSRGGAKSGEPCSMSKS